MYRNAAQEGPNHGRNLQTTCSENLEKFGCVVSEICVRTNRQRIPLVYLGRKGKGIASPYSITERRVPELIPVLDSQPAGDVSHKPDGRLPLLPARPAVTLATPKRAATNFAAW